MDRAFPRRKEIRLKQHDYNQPGYYSVTICTAVRNRGILCHIHSVGGAALGAPDVTLTAEGVVVAHLVENMEQVYRGQIRIDCFVIMPDHIHFLLEILGRESGSPRSATPTALPQIVNTLKGLATKQIGRPTWQRGYYDHVIRNDTDLAETRQYIANNPRNWILNKD